MSKKIAALVVMVVAVAGLSSCGNTIRGIGKDAANTVHATKDAGRSVDHAAR